MLQPERRRGYPRCRPSGLLNRLHDERRGVLDVDNAARDAASKASFN